MVQLRTPKASKNLLDMLLQAKLLTEAQVAHVRQVQQSEGRSELNILQDEQIVDPDQLALVVSLHLGVSFINLKRQEADADAVDLLPEWVCRKYRTIPVKAIDGTIQMAMENPNDLMAVDDLAAHTRKRIEPFLAFSQDIQEAIDRNYR